MGLLERGQRPGLGAEPGVVALGPRLLGRGEAAAVAEQEFREAMSGAQEIGADVLPTAEQVAGRFFLLGRNVNGRERAGAVEHRELTGIAAVRFDAIARRGAESGRARSRRRESAVRRQRALQLEAAGPGLVAAVTAPWRCSRWTKRRMVGHIGRQRMQRRRPCPGSKTAATVVAAC